MNQRQNEILYIWFWWEMTSINKHLFSLIKGGGGLYHEHTVNQQVHFRNWGGGLIRWNIR